MSETFKKGHLGVGDEYMKPGTSQVTSQGSSDNEASRTEACRERRRQPTRYGGKFDLYSTKLPFLMRAYLPNGTNEPDFYGLYKTLLSYQAKADFSMRISLHGGDGQKPAKTGRFTCCQVFEPMGDEEIGPISITPGKAGIVSLTTAEVAHYSTAGFGPGYVARLELSEEGGGCMINSGTGQFKMRKLWEGEHEGSAVKLFEGVWYFHTIHGSLFERKGFGPGLDYDSPFWGIRARRDDEGREIGIEDDE